MTKFLILTGCDNGAAYADIDQYVETLAIARREVADLAKLGCGQIRVYEFITPADLEAYLDSEGNKWPPKSAAKLIITRQSKD